MKTSIHPALAAIAALGVAFSPVLIAQQTAAPDQSQNTRAADSTADQHAADTGSPASQPGTLDKNNSKDAASETRDANPGTASTDSAAQSGTKDTTTADANSTMNSDMASHHAEKPLSDKEFVSMASQGGMTEVELGKVAGEKGNSSAVKDFGARMVKDHTQANDELKSIADKKGLPIASSLDARHQAMVDRMSKLSGPAFDKAYVNGMVRDHDKTVALFKQEAESGQDPDLKAFASKTLPTLEDHCSSIKSIKDSGVK